MAAIALGSDARPGTLEAQARWPCKQTNPCAGHGMAPDCIDQPRQRHLMRIAEGEVADVRFPPALCIAGAKIELPDGLKAICRHLDTIGDDLHHIPPSSDLCWL